MERLLARRVFDGFMDMGHVFCILEASLSVGRAFDAGEMNILSTCS